MNRSLDSFRRTAVAAALAAAVLAVGASPALAAPGFSVSISGPDTAQVGKPVLLKLSGKDPAPAEYWFNTYMDVNAIPASVLGACPQNYLEGIQVAENSWTAGGVHISGPIVHTRDAAGYWSSPASYTPTVPGRTLICAYSENLSNTLATDEHVIQVGAAAAAAGKGKRCKKGRKGRKCRKRK